MAYQITNIISVSGRVDNLELGTYSQTWQLGTGVTGILLKNTQSGLMVRNANDSETSNLVVKNLTVQGTQTVNNTQNVNSSSNYILLNHSGLPQNGGVYVLRSGQSAVGVIWDDTNLMWRVGFSGIEREIITESHTGQFASEAALVATGFILNQKNASLSGYSDNTFATIINVQQTGNALFNRDASISGGLEARLNASGDAAINHANGIGSITSGNLTNTGDLLRSAILTISGFIDQPHLIISSNTSINSSNKRILCNNSIPVTITFPNASIVSGASFKIKLINTGAVYLTGGGNFDGQPSYVMAGQYTAREVYSNNAEYFIF